MHVQMPPELLATMDIPITVVKSFYLLPSLMHRLESLMFASQLREEIGYYPSSFQISSSLACHITGFCVHCLSSSKLCTIMIKSN